MRFIPAVLTVLTMSFAWGEELPPQGARILHFDTDKILYDCQEPVLFRGQIQCPSHEKLVRWEIWIQHGIEPAQRIASGKIISGKNPSDIFHLAYTYKSAGSEYGHAARLVLKESKGREVDSKEWVYETYREWQKSIRLLFVGGYMFALDRTSPDFIDRVMQRAREARITTLELFGIGDWQKLPPDKEDMTYTIRLGESTQQVFLRRSRLLQWIRRARESGMHVMGYDEFSAMAEVPMEERVFFGKWDEPDVAHQVCRKPNGYFVVNPLKTRAVAVQNIVEQVRRFGFDGFWYDSTAAWLVECATRYADVTGRPLTEMSTDQLTEWWFLPTLEAARQIRPGFVSFVNNAAQYLLYPAHGFPLGRKNDVLATIIHNIDHIRYGKPGNTLRKQVELFDVWCSETDPESMRKGWFGTYEILLAVCKSVKSVTKRPFFLTTQISGLAEKALRNEAYAKPLMAVLLATGTGFSDHFALHGGLLTGERQDPVITAIEKYWNFAARYGEFLYDLNIQPCSAARVRVDGQPSLYWEDSVFERRFPDGTMDVYVHLLNLPEDHHIAVAHNPPPPARNVVLTVKMPGKKNVQAFFLSPDSEVTDPVPLRSVLLRARRRSNDNLWQIGGLPRIVYWGLVVVRWRPSSQAF